VPTSVVGVSSNVRPHKHTEEHPLKVFLSWSGETSHKVALALRDWLPSVIQSLEPYVSSEDIEKGARWSTDIAKELEKSSYGILCITKENMDAPWLNFEAGALSKSVEKGRVTPFLFGLKRSEVKPGPLLQFQSALAERDETLKLLQGLNAAHDPPLLEDARLVTVFEVWWPRLQGALTGIPAPVAPDPHEPKPTTHKSPITPEIVEEILVLLRQQQRLLNSPPDLFPSAYIREVLARDRDFPEGHPVFSDLEDVWTELSPILRESMAKGSLPPETLRSLDRMEDIMMYVARKFGRGPRARRRLVRPSASSTPE
jgi:hypothetical protein